MSLFLKECKAVLRSPMSFIYIFFLCLFLYMEYFGGDVQDGLNNNFYRVPRNVDITEVLSSGRTLSAGNNPFNRFLIVPISDNNTLIEVVTDRLWSNYLSNSYHVSRRNTRKNISLSERNQERIYNILIEMEEFMYGDTADADMDEFYRLMRQAGSIIGSDNSFRNIDRPFDEDIRRFTTKIAVYDEALAEYNKFAAEDGVSGGLARLFGRYTSIVCLLLGAIVSVFYVMKDKKSEETLSGKSISSVRLVITKYVAVNTALLLPVLVLALVATVQVGWIAQDISAARFDVSAFFRVSLLWVLPTNMFSTAFAMLITIVTGTPLAMIMLAPVWWMQNPFTDSFELHRLFIAFGSEFSFDLHRIARTEIIVNRLFYTGISVMLVCVMVWLYALRRGGRLNVQNLFRGMQKKH